MNLPILPKSKTLVLQDMNEGISDWKIRHVDDEMVIKSGMINGGVDPASIDCSDLESWSPEFPNLYEIEILGERLNFGFCHFSVTQDHIYLNDTPCYLRGYIRGLKAHDHDNFSFSNNRDFHEKHIRMAKSYGFNYVRWHSTIPDEEFLDLADRLGLLCHVEFGFEPIWGTDANDGNVLVGVKFDADRIRGNVSRLSLHPCVAAYCLGNEMHNAGTNDEVRKMIELIRSLDTSKLVLDSCGWGEYDRKTSDLYCQHMGYYFPFGPHRNLFNI